MKKEIDPVVDRLYRQREMLKTQIDLINKQLIEYYKTHENITGSNHHWVKPSKKLNNEHLGIISSMYNIPVPTKTILKKNWKEFYLDLKKHPDYEKINKNYTLWVQKEGYICADANRN